MPPAFLPHTVLPIGPGRDYHFHVAAAQAEAQLSVSCPGACAGARQSLDGDLVGLTFPPVLRAESHGEGAQAPLPDVALLFSFHSSLTRS